MTSRTPPPPSTPASDADDPYLSAAAERVRLHALRDAVAQADPEAAILPGHIAAYVRGQAGTRTARIQGLLSSDSTLRRLYRALLEQRRVASAGRQVAASSGTRDRLVVDQATIIWQVLDEEDRYLVLLTFDQAVAVPEDSEPVLHLCRDDELRQLSFPAVVGGASQTVVSSDDPALEWLRSSDAEAGEVSYEITV